MKEGGTGLHKTIREINLVYKGLILTTVDPDGQADQLTLFSLPAV